MSRHGFHAFTSTAPCFGEDVDSIDPFYQVAHRGAERDPLTRTSLNNPERAPGLNHERTSK